MAESRSDVLRLPAGHEAVAVARRAFAPYGDLLPPGWFFDASICLAEVITHLLLSTPPHLRSELALELSLADDVLRVEVERPQAAPAAAAGDLDGLVLTSLASRFGSTPPPRARLWFECDVRAGESARAPRAAD